MRTLTLAALLALALALPALAQQQANEPASAPAYAIVSTACAPDAPDSALPTVAVRTQAGGKAYVWVRSLVLEGRGTCGALRAEDATEDGARWRVYQEPVGR